MAAEDDLELLEVTGWEGKQETERLGTKETKAHWPTPGCRATQYQYNLY